MNDFWEKGGERPYNDKKQPPRIFDGLLSIAIFVSIVAIIVWILSEVTA